MIGIYGGTFNPVHYGHLRAALEVKELFKLQQMRVLPCRLPPHKSLPVVSGEMRLQMLKLAIANTAELQLDSRELERPGPSYMVDTLQSLRQELGDATLLLFMGADAFAGLQSWHQWRQLFDYAHVVVMTRPGFDFNSQALPDFFQQRLVDDRRQLQSLTSGRLFFQAVTLLDISATQIRQIIAEGLNPQYLLPDAVLEFIRRHQLYQAAPLTTGH